MMPLAVAIRTAQSLRDFVHPLATLEAALATLNKTFVYLEDTDFENEISIFVKNVSIEILRRNPEQAPEQTHD